MKKSEIEKWASENGFNIDYVLMRVRGYVEQCRSSWAAIELMIGDKEKADYIRPGYRKNTTDQYVPNAYLYNFGWKNTYYQHARLVITFATSAQQRENKALYPIF